MSAGFLPAGRAGCRFGPLLPLLRLRLASRTVRPGVRSALPWRRGAAEGHSRRPVVWAALSYLLIGTIALWPSIRPGRTLVPSDLLVIVTPYSVLPGAGDPDNLQLSDATFQFFPWFRYMAEGLRDGEIRQWNPTLLGGVPVTPNGNVSAYYPPSWLGGVMSPYDAYDLFVLLHLVIGALGAYVLARALGARPLASWVAGLLAFTAAFWVHWSTHLGHVAGMVWVPWALAATWWLLERPSRRRVAALAVVVGIWIAGGSAQYLYYGGLAVGAWAAAIVVGRRVVSGAPVLRRTAAFAVAMGLGALLAAPVVLPTAATAGRVARSRETEPPEHTPKREAIRLLVPDATGNAPDRVIHGSNDELRMNSPFTGVTSVLLAGAALAGGRRRRLLLVGTGLAAVAVLAFTGLPNRVLYEALPGYDRFRSSSRWLFLLPTFALPLAALGLHDLLAGARRARVGLVVTAGIALVSVGGWFAYEQSQTGAPVSYLGRRALLAAGVVAVVATAGWLARSRPALAVAVVAAAALGEVAFHTPRWYPSVEQAAAYPDTAVSDITAVRGGRFVRVGARSVFPPFPPDLSMLYGAADVHGLSVLFPKDYDRFLRLIDDYGLYAEEFNVGPPLLDGNLLESPLLDALDVRTVVAEHDVPIPGRYRLVAPPGTHPWVYERPSPGGAVLVPAAPATSDEMWARIAQPGWDPSAGAAVVGLPRTVAGGGGTVTARPAPSDRERWDVESSAGGFLRVAGRWDPGWSATVDGTAAPVLRADGIFRGVVVPAGAHTVRFTYRNPHEMRGRLAAGGGLLVVVGLVVPWPAKGRHDVNRLSTLSV